MTQTMCSYTETKQLHLVNIITFAEDKLQTNFARILSRINHQDKVIEHNKQLIDSLSEKIKNLSNGFQQKLSDESSHSNQLIKIGNSQISKIKEMFLQLSQKVHKNQETINDLSKLQQNFRFFIDEDSAARNIQHEGVKQKIRNIQLEIYSISNTLEKKQTINQVQKIRQSINQANQLISKIQDQQKFVQYKLDKFEVMNQKTEKNQLNKQINMIKELQQKIRNQLRNTMGVSQRVPFAPVLQNQTQQSTQKFLKQFTEIEQICSIERPITVESSISQEKREPSSIISFQSIPNNQKLLNHIHQTMATFERKFQHIENQIKQIAQFYDINQKQKKINITQIEEKIHSIRPQLIKLWAKCDALQDKNLFLERKLEQKNKQINHITQMQKETQSSRFQDKLKMLQTQIYSNLKQLKSKVDSKVNNVDYEKYVRALNQKIQILNDQILVKSDKLQVKKALLFLQSKIKQIILVISQDEQNEKDALLTKKQIKCISCDKDIQKFMGVTSNMKGNWDAFPSKQHSPQVLGRFGMTSFGTLARKLKRLDNKDIPVLSNKRNKESVHSQSKVDYS